MNHVTDERDRALDLWAEETSEYIAACGDTASTASTIPSCYSTIASQC